MTRYSQFKQTVRRYAPSVLLPAVAARTSQIAGQALLTGSLTTSGLKTTVAYSAVARLSLLFGNEYRYNLPDADGLEKLVDLFWEASDPVDAGDYDVWALVEAFMYEQFRYQYPVSDELTRSYLMLCETEVEEALSQPDPLAWTELLGASIQEAFSASFMFYVSALHGGGLVDPTFLEADGYKKFESSVPRTSAQNVLRTLTATVDEAKKDWSEASSRAEIPLALERFAYSPLSKTPIIDLGNLGQIAPQPDFIIRAMHPENLYYRGMRKWADKNFGKAYGTRVEAYTGLQLKHTGKLHVEPEFTYHTSSGDARSSDWFVITLLQQY